MPIQAADVLKILASVFQMVKSGNRVVFDSEDDGGSYVTHKATGRRTKMKEENGSFVFWLRLRKRKGESEGDFHRQVAEVQKIVEAM